MSAWSSHAGNTFARDWGCSTMQPKPEQKLSRQNFGQACFYKQREVTLDRKRKWKYRALASFLTLHSQRTNAIEKKKKN
jgi:hypothetical protein